eukprot:GHVR01129166.1.p1 GENE.GHVR01129166.1~~GHVR01129166.1.p1  ORF type:complete len:164 (+),score=9.87 GHVR01129166.1:57-548(+)
MSSAIRSCSAVFGVMTEIGLIFYILAVFQTDVFNVNRDVGRASFASLIVSGILLFTDLFVMCSNNRDYSPYMYLFTTCCCGALNAMANAFSASCVYTHYHYYLTNHGIFITHVQPIQNIVTKYLIIRLYPYLYIGDYKYMEPLHMQENANRDVWIRVVSVCFL